MKKRFFGILLMGALAVASMSTFTSCKDYDDDIAKLQEQIDANSKTIKEIQTLISNGGVIKTVSPIENGVLITASNGDTFTITNGKDGAKGADGTTWTIKEDGYWYMNGEKTEFYALGTAATSTTTTIIEASPKYYIPNPNTGFFDIYQDGVKVESTTISFLGTGAITATMDQNNLVLYGIPGALGPNSSVSISLTTGLAGLVFIPELYLDGIEAIKYPWIGDSILVKKANAKTSLSHHANRDGVKLVIKKEGLEDYLPNRLGSYYDFTTNTIKEGQDDKETVTTSEWIYGPVWPVQYHLNPATAAIDFGKNDPHFNVLEPDVVNFTRATKADLGITSPEKYEYWQQDVAVFGASRDGNGVGTVTVGLQIEHPENLAPWPTDNRFNPDEASDPDFWYCPATQGGAATAHYGRYHYNANNKDNTIALQMKNADDASEIITSDYALLVPLRYQLEGLVWTTKPQYAEPKGQYVFPGGPGVQDGDEKGWFDADQVHIWDSPEEALADPRGAALELDVASEDGVDLKNYVGVHYIYENILNRRSNYVNYYQLGTWENGQEKAFGLHYDFELVYYTTDTNETSDTHYAALKTGENGVVVAKSVTAGGATDEISSATSADKEPLVRVLLKNKDNQVLLDGYILLHITFTKPNKEIAMPEKTINFDLCNANDKAQFNWSEFSRVILQDGLNNMERRTFDNFYWADCQKGNKPVDPNYVDYVTEKALEYSTGYYVLNQWNNTEKSREKGNGGDPSNDLGTIVYHPNTDGTTNHTFYWQFTETELEDLTHDKADTDFPIVVTRWVRFAAKDRAGREVDNYNAPYPYVWLKLTVNINRNAVTSMTYEVKNNNYWYNFMTGADNGWSGVLLDIKNPDDRETTAFKEWSIDMGYFLKGNRIGEDVDYAGKVKYFFAPKDYSITTQYGTYRITAEHPNYQPNYNEIYCKHDAADIHVFNAAEGSWDFDEKVEEYIKTCAINYNGGAFDNTTLYAEKDDVYTPIAVIVNPEQDNKNHQAKIKLVHRIKHGLPADADDLTADENLVAYYVLNAVGYAKDNTNINTQLRAWIGVVAQENDCNRAKYVEQAQYDEGAGKSTFLASWHRPINVTPLAIEPAVDAQRNYRYLVDCLQMYDWRGPKEVTQLGYMYDDHQWYWSYYNIRKIEVDLRPTEVYTNMHQADPENFVKLSTVTNDLRLYPITVENARTATAYVKIDDSSKTKTYPEAAKYGFDEFNLYSISDGSFTISNNNTAMKAFMGITPSTPTNKAMFGGIAYENLGGNVSVFKVRFPVTIWYEWGPIKVQLEWQIGTTEGH